MAPMRVVSTGNGLGTSNAEPSKNIPGIQYIPIIFLLHSWASLFGVSVSVPLARKTTSSRRRPDWRDKRRRRNPKLSVAPQIRGPRFGC